MYIHVCIERRLSGCSIVPGSTLHTITYQAVYRFQKAQSHETHIYRLPTRLSRSTYHYRKIMKPLRLTHVRSHSPYQLVTNVYMSVTIA